jgi:hypothetical protein
MAEFGWWHRFAKPAEIEKFLLGSNPSLSEIIYGELAEWFMAVVLKTTWSQDHGGSNPSLFGYAPVAKAGRRACLRNKCRKI